MVVRVAYGDRFAPGRGTCSGRRCEVVSSSGRGTWWEQAACQEANSEELFADGAAQSTGKKICAACRVKTECLAHALDTQVNHGLLSLIHI